MMLPVKKETHLSTRSLHKTTYIHRNGQNRDIPLRTGAKDFIDELIQDNVKIVLIGGTASDPNDSVVSAVTMNLGPSRSSHLTVITFGSDTINNNDGEGEDDAANAGTSGMDEAQEGQRLEDLLKAAQGKAKTSAASGFVTAINRQGRGLGMDWIVSYCSCGEKQHAKS